MSQVLHFTTILWLIFLHSFSPKIETIAQTKRISYPVVDRDDTIVNTREDVKVPNPYKWMQEVESAKVKNFIALENNLTSTYLTQISPTDSKIIKRIMKKYEHEAFLLFSCPVKAGDRYFMHEMHDDLVFMKKDLKSKPVVILSTNWTENSKDLRIYDVVPSHNGDIVAVSFECNYDHGGNSYKFLNTKTKEFHADVIVNVTNVYWLRLFDHFHTSNPLVWGNDNSGVYYMSHSMKPGTINKEKVETLKNISYIFYHQMGTNQSQDIFIGVANINKEAPGISGLVLSDNGKYLIVTEYSEIEQNRHIQQDRWTIIQYFDLCPTAKSGDSSCKPTAESTPKLIPLLTDKNHIYKFLGNKEKNFYILVQDHIFSYDIFEVNLAKPEEKNWVTVISQSSTGGILTFAHIVHSKYLVTSHKSMVDSTLEVRKIGDIGNVKQIPLEHGVITGFSTNKKDSTFIFNIHSFFSVGATYTINLCKLDKTAPKHFQLPGHTDDPFRTKLVTERKEYEGAEGKMHPILVFYPKGTKKDGNTPTILFISTNPSPYDKTAQLFVPFMETFYGAVALATIPTHGSSANPPTETTLQSLDSAINYLIENKYTRSTQLTVATGASGLSALLATSINQNPKKYGAVIFVHTERDLDSTRFGNDKASIEHYLKISPIHNVNLPTDTKVQYPAIFIADNGHSNTMKYVAELQYKLGSSTQQTNPILAMFHMPNIPMDPSISMEELEAQQFSDMFSFLALSLRYKVYTDEAK